MDEAEVNKLVAQKVKELVEQLGFDNAKGREMAIDEIAVIQPGLGRIMPEIGARTWKLFYAGKAENWPLAMYQWKEAKKLFELGMYTRPKHEDAMEEYLNDNWAPLKTAIDNESLDEFMQAMDEAVDAANAWHEKKDKGYIRWKVPSEPPPDIDFEPRK